jgi:hypothetical protein
MFLEEHQGDKKVINDELLESIGESYLENPIFLVIS